MMMPDKNLIRDLHFVFASGVIGKSDPFAAQCTEAERCVDWQCVGYLKMNRIQSLFKNDSLICMKKQSSVSPPTHNLYDFNLGISACGWAQAFKQAWLTVCCSRFNRSAFGFKRSSLGL